LLLLGAEALLASLFLDGATIIRRHGVLSGLVAEWGAWVVRAAVGFAALFVTFVYLRHQDVLLSIALVAKAPVHRGLLVLHAAAIVLFGILSAAIYKGTGSHVPPDLLIAGWMAAAVAAVVCAALALAPYRVWVDLRQRTGSLWIYAAIASIAACAGTALSWVLWAPATQLTFRLVRIVLTPFVTDLIVQPERMRIGTTRFTAIIAPECSGLEGAALLVVFAVLWMILFRKEIRFL
jgi:hypothetical protein